MIQNILDIYFSIQDFVMANMYAQAIVIVLAFLLAAKILTFFVQRFFMKWAERSETQIDDLILEKIKPPFSYIMFFVGIKLAMKPLGLDGNIFDKSIDTVVIIAAIYIAAAIADILIMAWGARLAQKTESELDDALIPLFSKGVRVVIFMIGLIWILGKWGIDVTPLVASLGVAGLALSFAVKDSLANIFGGISLILDQAMKVGDKVKLESGEVGIIHDIGLRSTRLRTFSNEIIIIPNGKFSNSRIQNYVQPTPLGRVTVDFGVEYGSDTDKVREEILNLITSFEEIMVDEDHAPAVLFLEMGDSALKFSARFWVNDQSNVYAKKLEAMDKIYKTLNEKGFNIPFPTQTVYVRREE